MGHQKLPRSGREREALREKGQFWTPDWVARGMTRWVLKNSRQVFDPAVGAGAFFIAAKAVARDLKIRVRLSGRDIDERALQQAREAGLTAADLCEVELRDFLLDPPACKLSAIVANPPYIRHHRLTAAVKTKLHRYAECTLGASLDGRAGIHVFFLIKALELLAPGGRLAFILPADTCEGKYAEALWNWISKNYRLHACATFDAEATPFPGVDTNALVYFISNEEPFNDLAWIRVHKSGPAFEELVSSDFETCEMDTATVTRRALSEAMATGLSRPPREPEDGEASLHAFVRVMRGIATGDNEYFLFNSEKVKSSGIPLKYFRRTVPRTRYVEGELLSSQKVDELDRRGIPTYLLCLPGLPISQFPESVVEYLRVGEDLRIPDGTLISTRNPWYRMEHREVPPFLFAYLGRRRTRFIRNEAGIVPLTGFLCVYPKNCSDLESIWEILSDDEVIANLSYSGKSYGSGAIKVEPRALEKTIVPARLACDIRSERQLQAVLSL